jgi:protein-S-isoprenylcysteine O-methyltransferase Ste14
MNILNKINSLFNHKKTRFYLLRFRYPICLVLIILILPMIHPSLLLPGFFISLFGELIQLWSFASLDKNANIAARGPYCLLRNPMYIGRFFLILGGILLLDSLLIIIIFTILYYFYMVNRVKREEAKLLVIFGEEYRAYCSRVKRFLPTINNVSLDSLLYFRWKLLFQNHGHWNFIGMLSLYLLYYLFIFIKTGIH